MVLILLLLLTTIDSDAVIIECKKIEVKSLGEPDGCPITIEVNRGAKK